MIDGRNMLAEAITAGVIAGSYSLAARDEPRLAEDLELRFAAWRQAADAHLAAWLGQRVSADHETGV